MSSKKKRGSKKKRKPVSSSLVRQVPANQASNQQIEGDAPTPVGMLSVVATPIGNLEDITLRALRILRECDAIVAEDTRHTRKLCTHYEIDRPLFAFHAHSSDAALEKLKERLSAGQHLAVVSDAGTPLVSDPGGRLVQAAVALGVCVQSLPGPSAVLSALAVSGLARSSFYFAGFLPRSGSRRKKRLAMLSKVTDALVLFESPSRLPKTLRDLKEAFGEERRASVCRELTKMHEEVVRGTLTELSIRFSESARGEITLVIEGREAVAQEPDLTAVREDEIQERMNAGVGARETAKWVAEQTGLNKRDAYRRVLEVMQSISVSELPADS